MIAIKRGNTLAKEAYVRYRQDPRLGQNRDNEAFRDVVQRVVISGPVFRAAQNVLGTAVESPAGEVLAEGDRPSVQLSRALTAPPEGPSR